MVIRVFKSRDSVLRRQIKVFKRHADDLEYLKGHESALLRTIYLSSDPSDISWRAEGHHVLAVFYHKTGEIDKAKKHFIESISLFGDHEILGLCRAKRDHAVLLAEHESVALGLYEAEQALLLHDDDLKNRKGLRQKRITMAYLWYLKLMSSTDDDEARQKLIEFALHNCHDCAPHVQQQLLGFALDYASGVYRQQIHLRLGILYASRKKPIDVAKSAIWFGIDAQVMIASRIIRTILRRE